MARPPLVGWNIALLLALLAGCAVLPPPATFPNRPQQAETAARKGNHAQAAQLYEAAAAARAPSEQADLLLAAAREWLAAGSTVDGARVIGMLTASAAGLTPEQNFERTMLDAEVTLVGGHPAAAWQKISAVAEPTAAPAAPRYLQLRLRIALAAARPVDAVRAEISAERYSTSPAERTQLRSQLLAQLRQARERGVKLEPQASNDPVVRGWLDLAAVASDERGISLTGAGEAARWRARNPNHPATELLAQAFPPTLTAPAAAGTRVALLLPLSGPAAGAAGTIRDGFMSAYYQLPAASRPDLHIYDTAAVSATSAVAQARAEGSAFIVGPLTRADVAAVADLGPQSVPVLALNFLPGDRPGPGGFYQFALSPEGEARLIARRILAEGRRRGIALIPNGDWGNRVLAAFSRELNAGGGSLLATSFYDTAGHDYGPQIKAALRLSDSEARLQRLQTVLGTKLSFEPRRRADVQFIFAPAQYANNALLLEPQLRFHYAGDIPTYSTSDAYEPDATDSNQDLNGLMYPDMPWMVNNDGSIGEIRHTVEQIWGNRVAWRSRYFAFGYDACQLLLALQSARRTAGAVEVAGLTGQLSVDADRRVNRELIWAQIRNGAPTRLSAPDTTTVEGTAAASGAGT